MNMRLSSEQAQSIHDRIDALLEGREIHEMDLKEHREQFDTLRFRLLKPELPIVGSHQTDYWNPPQERRTYDSIPHNSGRFLSIFKAFQPDRQATSPPSEASTYKTAHRVRISKIFKIFERSTIDPGTGNNPANPDLVDIYEHSYRGSIYVDEQRYRFEDNRLYSIRCHLGSFTTYYAFIPDRNELVLPHTPQEPQVVFLPPLSSPPEDDAWALFEAINGVAA